MTNTATHHHLVADPGRLHVCTMLPRYIASDLRQLGHKIKRRLGLRELAGLIPEAYRIPDSKITKEATALVRALSDDMMLNHCYRTYAFGAILAHRDKTGFDREVFYLSAIMHDLGLTEQHAAEVGSFEWVGAKAALDFCKEQAYDPVKSELVHNAIALHSSVGIAHKQDPEIALVHLGAGVDVLGLRFEDVPGDALREVLELYPRLDFKNSFSAVLLRQAELKPGSHIAGPMGLGFEKRVRTAPYND